MISLLIRNIKYILLCLLNLFFFSKVRTFFHVFGNWRIIFILFFLPFFLTFSFAYKADVYSRRPTYSVSSFPLKRIYIRIVLCLELTWKAVWRFISMRNSVNTKSNFDLFFKKTAKNHFVLWRTKLSYCFKNNTFEGIYF